MLFFFEKSCTMQYSFSFQQKHTSKVKSSFHGTMFSAAASQVMHHHPSTKMNSGRNFESRNLGSIESTSDFASLSSAKSGVSYDGCDEQKQPLRTSATRTLPSSIEASFAANPKQCPPLYLKPEEQYSQHLTPQFSFRGSSRRVSDYSEYSKDKDSSSSLSSQTSSQETVKPAERANFGSLLDAISLVEEQESLDGRSQSSSSSSKQQWRSSQGYVSISGADDNANNWSRTAYKRKPSHRYWNDEEGTPLRNNKHLNSRVVSRTPPTKPLQVRKLTACQTPDKATAQQAAEFAVQTLNDADLQKRLLLSMALARENPRTARFIQPGEGYVLKEGFVWANYPILESVLKDNMAEYYELSITRCQSAQQQAFNNNLVRLVREKAQQSRGWSFDSYFTDKLLRDRIRCYYKTHIQNAKKRLRTMLRNPTKRANARHLMQHYDLIHKTVVSQKQKQKEKDIYDSVGGTKRVLNLEPTKQVVHPNHQVGNSYNNFWQHRQRVLHESTNSTTK